jgi:hypothetical protein
MLGTRFGRNRWNSLVTWLKWKLFWVSLEIVFISAQDRCTVYAKCTIGLEIFLGHPTVVLVDVSQVEARFGQFGDSVNLDTRYVYGLRRACNRI